MARTINTESKKRYATLAIRWCESYFGLCDRKKRRLIFRFSERKRKMDNFEIFGNYCFYRNEIIIYLPNNNTIYDIVATVIHEYTHYLENMNYQDIILKIQWRDRQKETKTSILKYV